jgi:hypothetical protein
MSHLGGEEYEKIFSHKLTYEKIWIAIEYTTRSTRDEETLFY